MKKIILSSLLICILFLTGCTQKKQVNTVKVLIPSGGPTFAFINMINDNKILNNYKVEYEVVSGPDLLVAAITSKSHDIVVAPTNVGAKLYNGGSNYIYTATVSFGNLFLVSKNNVNLTELSGNKILAFSKGSTPDIILQKVLQNNNLLNKVTIDYVENVNDITPQLESGKYNFALIAEPALSAAKNKTELFVVSDMQEEYQKISGKDSYPQAGVFVDKTFLDKNQNFINSFLNELKNSITFVNENKDLAANYYISNNLVPTLPKNVIIDSISRSNVRYKDAQTSKEDLNAFLQMVYEFNDKLIGGKLPDTNFYYQSK